MSNKYAICDSDNYNINIKNFNFKNYYKLYIQIILDFLAHVNEQTHFRNKNYFIFIVKRGILTLSHIFHFLLLYTKNINLTITHCRKSIFYYVEFIEQVSNENHIYLQLNFKRRCSFCV